MASNSNTPFPSATMPKRESASCLNCAKGTCYLDHSLVGLHGRPVPRNASIECPETVGSYRYRKNKNHANQLLLVGTDNVENHQDTESPPSTRANTSGSTDIDDNEQETSEFQRAKTIRKENVEKLKVATARKLACARGSDLVGEGHRLDAPILPSSTSCPQSSFAPPTQPSSSKEVVCNASSSQPGSFTSPVSKDSEKSGQQTSVNTLNVEGMSAPVPAPVLTSIPGHTTTTTTTTTVTTITDVATTTTTTTLPPNSTVPEAQTSQQQQKLPQHKVIEPSIFSEMGAYY